jgi:2-C-methyl-D-erythritol 4-phosphate cytidylyltransferase/2-C-methyl-D-erythritol 2,4-cyclodiphosphate synthase
LKRVALIPAAGMGKRMGSSINKQYLLLGGKPILAHTLQLFEDAGFIDEIYPIVPEEEIDYCRAEVVERYGFTKVKQIVAGGAERQHSVLNGLQAIAAPDADDLVLIHDGVRPFVPLEVVRRSIEIAMEHQGALVAVPVKDTVKVARDGFAVGTPPREALWLAQTPQVFRYGIIRAAHESASAEGFLGTDDASLLERVGVSSHIVIGDYRNIKITTPEDMILAEAFLTEMKGKNLMRIGHGYDVHCLVTDRKLILGGVEIPFGKGLLGHSDADVLLHAISDAILGAMGEGDIGRHFPDTDPAYKGASSIALLKHVMTLAARKGFSAGNIDATVVAQRPKLAPYIGMMKENIAAALNCDPDRVNIKATTTEELGFAGRGEGIAAYAVALMSRKQL